MSTVVWIGSDTRNSNSNTLVSDSVTTVAGDIVFAYVEIADGGGAIPDLPTGHADGDGWVQVETAETISSISGSLWCCRSAGATETANVPNSTTEVMTAVFCVVSGSELSGTPLNAILQIDHDANNYSTEIGLALPGATGLVVGFWIRKGAAAFTSIGTELGNQVGGYSSTYMIIDSDTGETAPGTNFLTGNGSYIGFALEMKEVGNVGIDDVDTDNIIEEGQTTIAVNLQEGGNSATAIKLKSGSIETTQDSFAIVSDTQITFDATTIGNVPFGAIELIVVSGGNEFVANIVLNPQAGNEYVTVLDPVYDDPIFLSILDSAPGPTPVDGDQLEITDPTSDVTMNPTGMYFIEPGGVSTFDARRWSITTGVWGDWVTETVFGTPGANQRPVVTAPVATEIAFEYGGSGLSKSDSTLIAWLASATVTDDVDTGLVAPGDITALADPIIAGTYTVSFLSNADAGGLTGIASTSLTIVEAQPAANTAPVVTATDTAIEFTYGSGGLAKTNAALVSWLANGASVTDDTDSGLTASGDDSGLLTTILAGTYDIVFTSQADAGSLTGSDTGTLTVSEAIAPNTAPVITPPSDTEIEFIYGLGGLAKDDSTLVSWLASATAVDDYDTGLVPSGDVSALADPIPAGTYTVSFAVTDSGSLTGQDTAELIITESAISITPITNSWDLRWNVLGAVSNNFIVYWDILNETLLTNIPLPNRIMKIL